MLICFPIRSISEPNVLLHTYAKHFIVKLSRKGATTKYCFSLVSIKKSFLSILCNKHFEWYYFIIMASYVYIWWDLDRLTFFLWEFIVRQWRERIPNLSCFCTAAFHALIPDPPSIPLCGGSSLAGLILTQRALQTQPDKYLQKSLSSKIDGKPWSGCGGGGGGGVGSHETDRKAENKCERRRWRRGGA